MRRFILIALFAGVPTVAAAQASQFGVRGLGIPGRAQSARALATGGSFALFDPGSALNPAALGQYGNLTATLTGIQNYRSSENPAGEASGRDSRFPLVQVAAPLGSLPFALSFGYSTYTVRDFGLATVDTIVLRGSPVEVADTLTSQGGIADIRFGASYRLANRTLVGAAFHVITGSNRLEARRVFGDPAFQPISQRAEVSYAGVGVSVGLLQQLGDRVMVALLARSDGSASVDRDSVPAYDVDLPYALGAGIRWRVRPRLEVAAQGIYRTWSAANSDILEQGGVGAENGLNLALGGEYFRDAREPERFPIRFGARYARLPFPLMPDGHPTAFALAAGTGTRFASGRASVDLAIERVWRSAGDAYSEGAWLFAFTVGVTP